MSDYGDEEFREPVINLYALRTFDVLDGGRLGSIVQRGGHWENGVCVARCLVHDPDDKEHIPPMPPPCRCGIYGALTIKTLEDQPNYNQFCRRILTVMQAEGKTMLGTVGLRTAVARVVAYWCAEPDDERPNDAELCAAQFPGARRFRSRTVMAQVYGLR